MRRAVLIISFIISAQVLPAQQTLEDINSTLKNLYLRLNTATEDTTRCQVNDSIDLYINSYVNSKSVFTKNLRDLRYLGQITSPDSLLKIVTWNLALENHKGFFYSYIIRRKSKEEPATIYRLSSPYNETPILSDTTYSQSEWYGALYYDTRPVRIKGNNCWIVLGINPADPLITRKIIDVISFNESDSIMFGKKIFLNERLRNRVVFQYESAGMMTLRFNSDTSIVFDHLVPVGATSDNRPLYGADYSYDSYTFTNGTWAFSKNFDARNKE
ncbi:MAG TPA: hypothetical protein VK213_02095 [Bacteroidales bacterium]|nr:hypothetical protein [Bacteroidales bacterium]